MKKMVATIATGIIIVGTSATSVGAAEYKVQSGDSLWNIANNNNTTVDHLIELNDLNGSIIYPNQTIELSEQVNKVEEYTIKQGDTLGVIAKEHGVSVASLKVWNGLSGDLIITGQTLTLKEGNQPVSKQAVKQTQTAAPKQAASTTPTQAAPVAKQAAQPAPVKQTAQPKAAEGKKITVSTTAYTAECHGCSGVTATGMDLNNNRNAKVIAVDPSVIPLGTKVHVPGYGTAIAADTGGAIKGNKIDIHVPTTNEALNWGRRSVTITILD